MGRLVTVALVVSSLAACNNGSSNDDAGRTDSGIDSGTDAGPGNDAGMSCANYATADCAFLQACEPGQVQALYGTQANCQTVLTVQCLAILDAPGSNFTTSFVDGCGALLTTNGQACASGPKPLPVPSATDACALTGTVAGGGSCGIDAQCQSESCNRNGTLCGTCKSAGALGASCGPGTGVNCQRGLICSNKAVCATVVGAGSSCDLGVTTDCVVGAACVIASADAGTGTCMASVAQANAACNPQSIGQPRCSDVAGFSCNAASSTCQPITYAAAGSPCGPSDGGSGSLDVQCANGQCVNGSCVARAAAQGGCTVGVANGCAEGTVCVADPAGLAGTCTTTDLTCITRDAGYPNFEFAPSNVSLAQVFSQAGMAQDENLSSSCTIHTDAQTPDALCLNSPIQALTQEDGTTVNVVVVNSLTIQSGGTLNVVGGPPGGNGSGVPLIIISLSNITIEGGGSIVASSSSASNGIVGPGGGLGQTANSAGVPAPGGGAAATMSGTKGGGGGSFCGLGGPGGGSTAVSMAYGSRDLRPLVAGAAGGQGWYAGYGSGGGGLQLVAAGTIEVKAGGVVTAGGGGGIGASGSGTSTTGGGSGGAILIEAANLIIAGTVAANGGGGGGGDSHSYGTDGTPNATAAPGQPGVASQGSTGGAGSAGSVLAGAAGTNDAGTFGGGGGGGAGRVRLNSGNANASAAGTVSPSLTTRCATQGLLRGENAGP